MKNDKTGSVSTPGPVPAPAGPAVNLQDLHDNPALTVRLVKQCLQELLKHRESRIELARALVDFTAIVSPVEPLYDLKTAAFLTPMTLTGLKGFLSRNRKDFPPRYVYRGKSHRRVRMLYGHEIQDIRKHVVRDPRKIRYVGRLRPMRWLKSSSSASKPGAGTQCQ